MGYVDLHVHSLYSDGTLSPRQIVERAVAWGVTLLAIADHDLVRGSIEALPLARAAGLRFLPAVEIDTLFEGRDFHILAYHADFTNAALTEIIRDARMRMDRMSDVLLMRMRADYPALDPEEFRTFPHDTAQGGWKLLQYLVKKGLADSLHGARHFYPDYGVGYETAGFLPTEAVVRAVHCAGGRAVLAHPGETARDALEDLFPRLLALGLDGAECFYPKHSPQQQAYLLEECTRRGRMITAGSDCHGAFGDADVAQTHTLESEIDLRGL